MDKNNFATKMGHLIANILVGCLATCVASVAIALTVRFILWLF